MGCLLVAMSASASDADSTLRRERFLKVGLLTSLCVAQVFTGFTESYHFSDNAGYKNHVVHDDNYHVYAVPRRIGWIVAGGFLYANLRESELTGWGKARRITGCLLISRNFYEWANTANRCGNPFNYDRIHHERALVYLTLRNGRLVDVYIGTGPVSGPLVDAGLLVLGLWMIR